MKKILSSIFILQIAINVFAQQKVGIGTTTPISTLDIIRGTANGGTLNIRGSEYSSNFYFGESESIILRGGRTASNIYLNDDEDLGNVLIGTKLGVGTYNPNQTLSVANKFGIDENGSIHFNNTARQIYFFEDGMDSKMILSHSPSFPTRGLQYTANNIFKFLADSIAVMNVDLGLKKVEVTNQLGIGITPYNKLDVQNGGTRTGLHPGGIALYVTGNMGPSDSGFEIRHNNGTQGVGIGYNTMYATGNNPDQDLGLAARGPSGALLFSTNYTEKMRLNGQGYLGVGTSSPHALIHLSNAVQNRKIILYEGANNDHQFYGFGINSFTLRYQVNSASDSHVFYAGNGASASTELMRITGSGNVGIGNPSPNAPLQFANSIENRKIVMWESFNNDHQYFGLGINGSTLRYQVSGTGDSHVFFAGTSPTTSNELMRISGNGNVGIGTSAPNQKLSVANKFGVDANGSLHYSNTARQMYFYEDGLPNKMILSHSPSYPTWGLQYTNANKFRFLQDSVQVMAVDLGNNAVEVNGNLTVGGTVKNGYHIVEAGPVDVPGLSTVNLSCNCSPGEVVLGGGYWSNYSNACDVGANQPNGTTSWYVAYYNTSISTHQLKVYAICARLGN